MRDDAKRSIEEWESGGVPMLYVGDLGNHSIMYVRSLKKLVISEHDSIEGSVVDVESLKLMLTKTLVQQTVDANRTTYMIALLEGLDGKIAADGEGIKNNSHVGIG